jgi:D-3-phosphoglycerate dehydrogenase
MLPIKFPSCPSMTADPSFSSAHKDWSDLASIADVITPKSTNRADFIKESQGGAFDGVVAAYRTFQSVSITGLIDEELVSSLPKSLKYLSHNGTPFTYIPNIPLSTPGGGES